MFVIEIAYSVEKSLMYKFILQPPPFSRPISRDTLRRGVVVRSSNDPRSRESITTISLLAITCLPVSNESMILPEVDNIDEDGIENESPPPIGLPGRRPARRRARVVPELD